MKSKRIISSLMAALASTSSLMATGGNFEFRSKRGVAYTKKVLNTNGKREGRLRIGNTKGPKPLNLSLSGGSIKDVGSGIAQSNQNNKAKEMLGSVGRWIKDNPGKTIVGGLLSVTLGDALVRGLNEFVRLPVIYKAPKEAKKFEVGKGASNVVEVVKRFGGSSKKLVRKRISRFVSTGYMMGDFDSEVLACKMLAKWSKENENEEIFKHIAKVVDYHYGLGSLYVTYEEAEGVDREQLGIKNWGNERRLKWLHKVCKQVIDVALFFHSKGFYHGDLHNGNYSISGNEDDPHVNVFDFGRFYKVKKKGKNKLINTPAWDLKQILSGFLSLAIEIGLGKYEPPYGSFLFEVIEMNKLNEGNIEAQVEESTKRVTKTNDYLSNDEFAEKLKSLKSIIDQYLIQ